MRVLDMLPSVGGASREGAYAGTWWRVWDDEWEEAEDGDGGELSREDAEEDEVRDEPERERAPECWLMSDLIWERSDALHNGGGGTHPFNLAVGVCAQGLEVLELGHDAVEEHAHAACITRRLSGELGDLRNDRVDLGEEGIGAA
jgi:hypothetical protein